MDNDIHAYFCTRTTPYSTFDSCCRGMEGELRVAIRQNDKMRRLLGLLNGAVIPEKLDYALIGLGWHKDIVDGYYVWYPNEDIEDED